MFRLRFISFLRKNLKYSTNVVSATGTGKFDFGPRKSFNAVGHCFSIIRCKSIEGSFYLFSEFDKFVVPLYDKKIAFNPVVAGWWTRVYSLIINNIVHLVEPFLNDKLFRGDEFFKALSSAICRAESSKVIEKFRFASKNIEASFNSKKKLTKINSSRRNPSALTFVNTLFIWNWLKVSAVSETAVEDNHCCLSNCNLTNESYFLNIRLSSWPLSSVNIKESEFLDHRNRINYIKKKLLIPYEYLLEKLVGLQMRSDDFEADNFIKDEHFVDNAWMFSDKISIRKDICSCVKEDIPKLISEWPFENEFTKFFLSSYEAPPVEIDVIQEIAKDLNCNLECIQKYFTSNVLKAKMAKKMLVILRLLRKYGIANKQIRQSIEILNHSPVVIYQRLRLLQDNNCGNVEVSSLLLRENKFDLYFKKLKRDKSEIIESSSFTTESSLFSSDSSSNDMSLTEDAFICTVAPLIDKN